MEWLHLDVRRKHGFLANHVLLVILFVGFWIPWLMDDSILDRFALRTFSLPGLLTHMLLHVHSLHLVWNLVLLGVFGSAVCNELGSLRHGLLFLSFGMVAGMVHVLFDGDRAVGVSGAVAGFVGMTLVSGWQGTLVLFDEGVRCRLRTLAGLLVGKDLLLLVLPDIHLSVAGHLGGYAAGAVVGLLMGWRSR